jgi:hypothetical protein
MERSKSKVNGITKTSQWYDKQCLCEKNKAKSDAKAAGLNSAGPSHHTFGHPTSASNAASNSAENLDRHQDATTAIGERALFNGYTVFATAKDVAVQQILSLQAGPDYSL